MKIGFVAGSFLALVSAGASTQYATAQENRNTIQYTASNEDFPNPERGFYRYSRTNASNPTPLDEALLNTWKKGSKGGNGNYKVFSTLIFRYYEMDLFKDKALSSDFLDAITRDFVAVRRAGFKMIPRFTYTLKQTAGSCPEGFICPPYGDAAKAIVLQHITQLKTVLQQNTDVIAAVQMGFIGVWGEQYYTDFFGDASQNTTVQKLTDDNWKDRLEVLKALLDAVPKDRMIQVRYPQIKQRYVYGVNANVNAAALTEAEAFSETDKARIGFHNDCFLASANDYGTFEDYGNSSSPRGDANSILRLYKQQDSRFVVVGGETCSDAYSPQNDCEPSGRVQTEMKELHYSFLNCDYNNEVNNDWQTSGCMSNIKKNLGYRFVLRSGSFPAMAPSGGLMSLTLDLENEGYASPFNPRQVVLVLRQKGNAKEVKMVLDTDVRTWYTGSVKLVAEVKLPADIEKGKYDLFLSLADPYPSLAPRPEYAIRLANEKTWEATTGYNKLNATVEIK